MRGSGYAEMERYGGLVGYRIAGKILLERLIVLMIPMACHKM